MILEFLKIFLVGSITGGLAVRVWFRQMMDVSLMDVRVNLSATSNRKFRIIELVPFVGTALTHFKNKNESVNFAKQAFGMELIAGLTTYIVLQLVNPIVPLFFSLVWLHIVVVALFTFLVKAETTEQELSLNTNATQTSYKSQRRITTINRNSNGAVISNMRR